MILIREVPSEPPEDVEFEGRLAPVPGTEPNSILFEERDGPDVLSLDARALLYKHNDVVSAKAQDVRISLFVTAARFAFACTRYEKGRGVAGALRSRGKCLVGQIRYPWLSRVGSTCRTGRRKAVEQLVLCWYTSPEEEHRLFLTLDPGYTAAEWAAEIARRAARYRLLADRYRTPLDPELPGDLRIQLEALADVEPFREGFEDGQAFQLHGVPGAYLESDQAAALGIQLTAAELGDA